MRTTVRWVYTSCLLALVAALAWTGFGMAQLEGLEGQQAPDDVTGADCSMCHGTFAQDFQFAHEPALSNNCTACHQTTGKPGHGALTDDTRGLCLQCHGDKAEHYALASCWSAGCHADVHGSNANAALIPSRAEQYPGFAEATAGAQYAGSQNCLGCHADLCKWYTESAHSLSDAEAKTPPERRGCEGCHGPGGNHWGRWAGIGHFALASAAEADTACLKCHGDETYVPQYTRSIHAKSGVACISCHNPHNPAEKHDLVKPPNEVCLSCHESTRADFAKTSHHPVDLADNRTGMLCTDCHDPHGGEEAAMLKAASAELCVQCHVDKAGPFVYSHAGYETGLSRGCFTCHNAHGSTAPNLLNVSSRGVCLQCHTDMVQHMSGRNCWTAGCHSAHHGSNASYLFFD
jgi:DmsE family decaheme c-type cytochrome